MAESGKKSGNHPPFVFRCDVDNWLIDIVLGQFTTLLPFWQRYCNCLLSKPKKPTSTGGEMKPRESAISVLAVFFVTLLIFGIASTTPSVSVAYAENTGTQPLPADSSIDSASDPAGGQGSDEESIIDLLVDLIDAVL
jgi:hypothetical protein